MARGVDEGAFQEAGDGRTALTSVTAVTVVVGQAPRREPRPGGPAADELELLPAGRPELRALTDLLAALHTRGVTVDWPAYFAGTGGSRVDLPTYAFQRRRFWLESGCPSPLG